jgi:hypothetical protein
MVFKFKTYCPQIFNNPTAFRVMIACESLQENPVLMGFWANFRRFFIVGLAEMWQKIEYILIETCEF